MKKSVLILASALPVTLSADPADYVNFIRQVQQDSGVEWDVTVPPSGHAISPTGVSVDGAFFELWSIHNTSVSEFLLDEQYVTAYTPNANIRIVTGDPYRAIRRTRVDQPFQVQIPVTGLIDENDPNYATAPDASKWVDYTHSAFNYPEGAYSFQKVDNPVGSLMAEGFMEKTAKTTVTFMATNLSGSDLTKVTGEEVFTISAQADFGVSATVLDSEKVQIWPVATGTIRGTDPSEYYEQVPPIMVNLENLYPHSTTYIRVYEGPQTSSPAKYNVVNTSYVIIEDSIPQNRSLVIREGDQFVSEEGLHTIELLHRTPFGTDLLASTQVHVDRTIEINGGVINQE